MPKFKSRGYINQSNYTILFNIISFHKNKHNGVNSSGFHQFDATLHQSHHHPPFQAEEQNITRKKKWININNTNILFSKSTEGIKRSNLIRSLLGTEAATIKQKGN